MSDIDHIEVHGRVLTAFFDSRGAADKAVRDLTAAGIPKEHVSVVGSGSTTTQTTGGDKGFWDSLKDLFLPDEDRYGYAEGLRRGGYLVSVRCDEANYSRVMEILDADGSVDMDQREASWRSEGWTGYQKKTGAVGAGVATAALASGVATSRQAAPTGLAGTERSLQAGEDETLSLYEEQIRIGKRDVSHGRVRLKSYVVETPVTEQVSLRSERVEIERRPVDRAVSATDAAFRDRTIEAVERSEEAVVQKDVRVKEEIGLRKVAEDRTQTVSDKVRRTEVEIEDERGTVTRDAGSTSVVPPTPRAPKI